MAESELGVLSNQCLGRRIPNQKTFSREIAAGKKIATKIMPKPIGSSQHKHLYPAF
jgi:hypothetical protein